MEPSRMNTNDTNAVAAELAAALTPDDVRERALELIAALAPQGHALSFIAGALKRAFIPTLSGRGNWDAKAVSRLADKAGIPIAGYMRRAG
jgi:hypothetical protein